MVSSLLALPLEDSHEGVVVVYGDVAFEPRILRALLQETSSDIAITLDRQWRKLWELRMSDPLSDCEEVTVREGLVESLGGPASAIETVEVQYMGLLYFSRRGLSALASEYHKLAAKGGSGPRTSMTETLGSMVQQGQRVSAQEVEGGWLELDTDEDYAAYVDAWKSGLLVAYFDSSAS
jgi:choline kinase